MNSQEVKFRSQPHPNLANQPLHHPLLNIGLIGAIGIGSIAAMADFAQAGPLTSWNFDPGTNHLEVTIEDGATPRYFLMAKPARIVVDLPDTSVGTVKTQATYPGAVRQIRVSQFQPGLTRIVMELSPEVTLAPGQVELQKVNPGDKKPNQRWTLRPLIAQVPAVPEPPLPSASLLQAPPLLSPDQAPSSLPVAPTSSMNLMQAAAPAAASAPSNSQPSPPTDATVSQPISAPEPPAIANQSLDAAVKDSSAATNPEQQPPAPRANLSVSAPASTATAAPPAAMPAPAGLEIPSTLPSLNVVMPIASVPAFNQAASTSPPTPATSPSTGPTPAVSQEPKSEVAVDLPSTVPTIATAAQPKPIAVPALGSTAPSPSVSAAATAETTAMPPAGDVPTAQPDASVSATPPVSVPPLQPSPSVPADPPLENPAELPSVSVPETPSVSVPPLQPQSASPPSPNPQAPPLDKAASPSIEADSLPSSFPTPSAPSISVPPLQLQGAPVAAPTAFPSPTAVQQPVTPGQAPVLEFGQPLPSTPGAAAPIPGTPGAALPGPFESSRVIQPPGVLLPAGTLLSLRYPGETSLSLRTGPPHQEVLLLQNEIRDAIGNLIVPQGSVVIGRFETSTAGSRFITQAISLAGRNVPIVAQSDLLAGSRKVTANQMAIYSGVGALAGGLVGGFSGLGILGGAATGAAVNYFTSPKPATIQPDQILQIRLLEDLRS